MEQTPFETETPENPGKTEQESQHDNLAKATLKNRRMREQGIKPERLNPIEKAQCNPTSLRLAINGKCWECSNEQMKEVRLCHVPNCCLYPVRPYK